MIKCFGVKRYENVINTIDDDEETNDNFESFFISR